MILVHICCSVDSHFFLQKLKKAYPSEELVGFFYDPNIHPYSEYYLRLLDVKRSCKKLGVKLFEGEYDFDKWLEFVRGYENEPEKGARCDLCFDKRLEVSAKKAKELGAKFLTTTLLTSPKKSMEQLQSAGENIAKKYGLKFLTVDFRSGGGTQEQFALAKRDKLYHQDYCGCIYALSKQREYQERLMDEMFEPVSGQIQPESIGERIKLYEDVCKLEDSKKKYEIVRENFLNYRLLRAYLKQNKEVIPSYILAYSTTKRKFVKFRIEKKIQDIYFANRENIKLITLEKFNQMINKNYKNIKELLYSPPAFEEEIKVRNQIDLNYYSLSAVIVIKDIDQTAKYELYLECRTYQDVKEYLVTFG